jgi:hypothetical protein
MLHELLDFKQFMAKAPEPLSEEAVWKEVTAIDVSRINTAVGGLEAPSLRSTARSVNIWNPTAASHQLKKHGDERGWCHRGA